MGIDNDSKQGAPETQNDSDLHAQAEVAIESNNYDEALHIARRIQNDSTRDDLLKSIVKGQIGASQIDAAIETAREIKSEYSRDGANAIIVKALANAGRFEEAKTIAGNINAEYSREHALKDIAEAFAEAGRFEEAKSMVARHNPAHRSYIEELIIVRVLANAGRFEEAKAAIKGGPCSQNGHLEIAKALINAGRFEEVQAIINQSQNKYDWNWYRIIGEALANAGRFEEAESITDKIINEEYGQASRDWVFYKIALAQVKAGKTKEARATASNIRLGFSRKDNRDLKQEVFEAILQAESKPAGEIEVEAEMEAFRKYANLEAEHVESLAKAGNFNEAKSKAAIIMHREYRENALRTIVACEANAGRIEEAKSTALKIKDQYARESAHVDISAALAEAGKFDEAKAMAASIKEKHIRDKAYGAIVEVLIKSERLDEAANLAQQIKEDDQLRYTKFKAITDKQIKNKQYDGALATIALHGISYSLMAVIQEIVEAQVAAGKIRELIEMVEKIVSKNRSNNSFCQAIAESLSKAGLFDAARNIAKSIRDEDSREHAYAEIIAALAEAGKFDEAKLMVSNIKREDIHDEACGKIADVLVKAGRFAEAITTVGQFKRFFTQRTSRLAAIVEAQAKIEHDVPAPPVQTEEILAPAQRATIAAPESVPPMESTKPSGDEEQVDLNFLAAFREGAGVTAPQIPPRTTQPVSAVQVEGEELLQEPPRNPMGDTAKEVTAVQVHAVVRPAAMPPPVPADAEPTIRSTAQFSGVQPRTVVPPPTLEETLIAREVAGRMAGLFPAFPESGPGELQDAPLDDDADAFDSSPTMIGGPGAAQTLEVSGEFDPADHAKTVVWRPENLTRPSGDVEDDAQTGVFKGIPGLPHEENDFFRSEVSPQAVDQFRNGHSQFSLWLSRVQDGLRRGSGIVKEKIVAGYTKTRKFFHGLREATGRKIGQQLAQIEGARRARQIRLPAAESAEGQTVIVNRPGRSFLRSPFAWVIGGGAIAAGAFVLNARISEIRRGEELAESVRGPQVSAPAQLPEVVHAQTPKIPTLGPSAAPPERPMPQAAAKPQPKAPPEEPRPQPAAVPPPPKAAAPEKSPPRTINLDCAVLDGFPACYLPDDTSGARKPMDLNMKKDDREPAQTAGDIRGRLSVVLQGLGIEFVSRKPVEFRPGEASKPFGRIEFVERGK